MLERLATWFLNTYVAEYVGNINTDQLSIGILRGKFILILNLAMMVVLLGAVELEKLPLKKDALKKLNLPIEVKSGFIGKLKIEIPFRHLKSQPWVVQVDQLYLIAGPSVPPPVCVCLRLCVCVCVYVCTCVRVCVCVSFYTYHFSMMKRLNVEKLLLAREEN